MRYIPIIICFLSLTIIFNSCTKCGCTDPAALNYDSSEEEDDDDSCEYKPGPQVFGCTDSSALNYNPNAPQSDGSCCFDLVNNFDTALFANYTQPSFGNPSLVFDFGKSSPEITIEVDPIISEDNLRIMMKPIPNLDY